MNVMLAQNFHTIIMYLFKNKIFGLANMIRIGENLIFCTVCTHAKCMLIKVQKGREFAKI